MNNIKSYILLTWMLVSFVGCKMEDLKDDVNDLKDRVTLIEEQVKILNDNVEVLAYVLDPQQKTINNVTENNGKYVITLSDGSVLTLEAGAPGTVNQPEISVSGDGFWTINGEKTGVKAVGEDGVNGDGIPQFRVIDGKWQVRYGSEGAWGNWQEVPGDNIGGGSLGDQVFESAQVSGDKFVVVLADGKGTYELPIVARLTCAIDKTALGADGYIEFQSGERKIFRVKLEGDGEPLAPVYPAGWRAELEKLAQADVDGYNYQLVVYAPNQTSTASRAATADNTSEISVRAHKGVFWAVDKIKVKLPKVYNSNYEKFMDGGTLDINGHEISKASLGITDEQAIQVVNSSTAITGSGVFFVNADNVELTYDLGSGNKLDYLVILPYGGNERAGNARAKLTVKKQIYLNKFFVAQDVDIEYTATSSYVLRIQPGTPANVIMNGCKVKGMVAGSGFVMPNEANEGSLEVFSAHSCDFNIVDTKKSDLEKNISATNLINNMDCKLLEFVDNIFYRSVDKTDGVSLNIKVYNASARAITSLVFNQNTIVNLESTNTAMIYAQQIGSIEINHNIFWNMEMDANSMFIRYMQNMQDESKGIGSGNIGYAAPQGKTFKVCFTDSKTGIVCPGGIENDTKKFQNNAIFKVDDPNSFNTTTGVFVPIAEYKSYGAQR